MAQPIHNPLIRRAIKEQTIQYINFAPPAADDNYFKTSTALAAASTTLAAASMTKSYVPAGVAVCPVCVVTNDWASGEEDWTSVSVLFVGIDQFGDLITTTATGTVASHVWTATSAKAFLTLTKIVITITAGDGEAVDASDSYVLGFAKTYGLGCAIGVSGDVIVHNLDGATDAGTISTAHNTYLVAGTPDAAKLLQLYIRSTAP